MELFSNCKQQKFYKIEIKGFQINYIITINLCELNLVNSIKESKVYEECSECGGSVITNSFEMTCKECGLVLDKIYKDSSYIFNETNVKNSLC
jgi:Zn finger protein HypA/HybF involved in hydrogenase expression